MKFLLVNKFHYLRGGSERFYFTLADILEKTGNQVIFFSMKDRRNVPCKQEKYFVRNACTDGNVLSKLRLLMHMNNSKEAYRKISILLDEEKPDVAILNLVHKNLTLSIIPALKERHIKIIWIMHDLICACPSFCMRNGQGKICELCLDGNFHHCVENKCVHNSRFMSIFSEREAKYIVKENWYNDVDFYVCPSAFYKNILERAHFTKKPLIFLRNPLGFDTEYKINEKPSTYFLYFGRLSEEKGLFTLINAAKKTGIELKVVGTGPLERQLKNGVVQNGLNNRIAFEGFRKGKELFDVIWASKAVIIPSEWYENCPYSALEAMALGKPLIVSGFGGLPELVDDGINGFIYHNSSELDSCLRKMDALGGEEYAKMCQESLKIAERDCDPLKYVSELLDLIGN